MPISWVSGPVLIAGGSRRRRWFEMVVKVYQDIVYEIYLDPSDRLAKTKNLKYWIGHLLTKSQLERVKRLSKKNTVYLYKR
jgi:hypothetical protein